MAKVKKLRKVKKTASETKKESYFEAVGRRKTAVARVRIYPKERGSITVNNRELKEYFPLRKFQDVITAPFDKLSLSGLKTTVKVRGSGLIAQAEAVRLGVSRALVLFDEKFRSRLKALGFLKRDPRMVERKKSGLRKARRPQQWRKR